MKNPLLTLTAILFVITAVPLASAASLPVVGEFEVGANWGFGFVALAVVAIIGMAAAGKRLLKGLPGGKMIAGNAAVIAVVAILAASAINTGGALNGFASGADDAPAAAAAETATFAAGAYEATSDVTFTAADYEDKTALGSVAVKVYKPGVSDKAAVEGSATPEYSATMSSGSVTINGIQAQVIGCTVDVHLSISGYYEQIERNVNICVAKNPLGNNDLNVPTFYLKDVGTLSLASTATSLTCSAGSQCTYSVVVKNTEDDSWLSKVAVKWVESDTEDHSLDSVDAGDCEIVEVSSTKYVKFNSDLGPLEFATCAVKITRATGDTNGGYNMTADDHFTAYGATAWNTNSNILGATATSATEVTFA